MVSSGGDVTSLSGTRNCAGGSLCEFNITDKTFNESFTAVARPGYVFSKWSAGEGFQCANSINLTCQINNTGLPSGNAAIDGVIASDQILYIMPLFTFVGLDTDGDNIKNHLDLDDDNDGVQDLDDTCPLNVNPVCAPIAGDDRVTANGKVWAQADLFINLSWSDINAVCPTGVCLNETLNGHDMTGWKWASVDDMNALLNSYGVGAVASPNLGPGPDSVRSLQYAFDYEAVWSVSGWRRTVNTADSQNTLGLVRDAPISNILRLAGIGIYAPISMPYLAAGYVGTDEQLPVGYEQLVFAGAWFYR
jgi:hypothetical protein